MSACEVVTLTLNPAIDETITVPGFAAGAVNRVERVRQDPGGKGVNVASALTIVEPGGVPYAAAGTRTASTATTNAILSIVHPLSLRRLVGQH